MYVCGKRSVALVASRCSLSIVNRKMGKDTWKKKDAEVMKLSRETCISSVEQINLRVDGVTAEIKALVAQDDSWIRRAGRCRCNQGPGRGPHFKVKNVALPPQLKNLIFPRNFINEE